MKCAACGDEFRMSGNAVGERIKLGYCSGCYRQWVKTARVNAHGEVYYVDRPREIGSGTPYDSRLPERGSDS